MIDPAPRLVRSADGTFVAARSFGDGEDTPVLLVNAIGAGIAAWRAATTDLARARRIVTWDHRGLLGSGEPAGSRLEPAAHVEDALAVLDHHAIDRSVVVAWSGTGSRIALELAATAPGRVTALAIVCGGFGHPLWRIGRGEIASLLPPAAAVGRYLAGPLGTLLRSLAGRAELAGLIRQSGLVAPGADVSVLVELLRDLAECDTGLLLESYRAVAGDHAPELLDLYPGPVLLVAGERDVFAPVSLMREMQERLSDARLVVYDRATHYLPVEYPARLSNDLRTFFGAL